MTLDIRQADFWKLDKVDTERRRIYDIRAGCRRCLPLCPSYKMMFERLDSDAVDGDVEKLPAADVQEVVDLCPACFYMLKQEYPWLKQGTGMPAQHPAQILADAYGFGVD